MSLSTRHLRQQKRALAALDGACERWTTWRQRCSWVALLASAAVWLQHSATRRTPPAAAGFWATAIAATAIAALLEWRCSAARARQLDAIDRTERAIGWGDGPYRVRGR